MTTRRSMLKTLGLAPMAAPIAAKAAADAEIAKLAGLKATLPSGLSPLTDGNIAQPQSSADLEPWYKKVLRYLSSNEIPEWHREAVRRQCQAVQSLDPDLACKHSWSMSVRIATQRERNYQRALQRLKEMPREREAERDFYDRYGFWL